MVPMDVEVEITRRSDVGERVIINNIDVLLMPEGESGRTLTHSEARLVAKAIADYDKAIAALGYAK
jgi:hypothetical protein